jgi:hypothetical protein
MARHTRLVGETEWFVSNPLPGELGFDITSLEKILGNSSLADVFDLPQEDFEAQLPQPASIAAVPLARPPAAAPKDRTVEADVLVLESLITAVPKTTPPTAALPAAAVSNSTVGPLESIDSFLADLES